MQEPQQSVETVQSATANSVDYLAWFNAAIDLLNVLVWPIVVGILIGWVFRKKIAGLIDRIRKIGKEGIEAGPPPQSDATAAPLRDEQIEKSQADPDPLFEERTQILKMQLDETEAALDRVGVNRETALLRALARANSVAHFEAAYNQIWGSQISLLQKLNAVKNATVEEIAQIYSSAASSFPTIYSNYTVNQWLGFLQTYSLVTQTDNMVEITPTGQAFLKHIIDRRYTTAKLG